MYCLNLRYLEAGLRFLQDLVEIGTPRLPLVLRDDLQTCGEKLSCTFPHDVARVTQWDENLVEDKSYMSLEVCRAVASEFLQDENPSMSTLLRLLLRFVRLKQPYSGLDLHDHEEVSKGSAAYLRDMTQCLGRSEHDIDVRIWEKSLDIVVQPEKICLGINLSFNLHEMVFKGS